MRDDLKTVVLRIFWQFSKFFPKGLQNSKTCSGGSAKYIGARYRQFESEKPFQGVLNADFKNRPGTINWSMNLLSVIPLNPFSIYDHWIIFKPSINPINFNTNMFTLFLTYTCPETILNMSEQFLHQSRFHSTSSVTRYPLPKNCVGGSRPFTTQMHVHWFK